MLRTQILATAALILINPAIDAQTLTDTGLYQAGSATEVAEGVLAYTPNYELWSDGMKKSRWLKLPEGTQIDTSDINRWVFPTGTKLWKEFRIGERKVETRVFEKTSDGVGIEKWTYRAYVWNAEETVATLAPTGGIADHAVTELGTNHSVPSVNNCKSCHKRGGDPVLGFDALQLAGPGVGVRLEDLVAAGRVSQPPVAAVVNVGTSADEQFSLGYLHANCGGCHNADASVGASTGLHLRYEIGKSRLEQPAFLTAVGGVITAGDPASSYLVDRLVDVEMPPLGAQAANETALTVLRNWIESI